MSYVNSYRVTLTMENNSSIEWEGYAEDESHAEGLAIEYATKRTGEQVKELEELEEFDQFEIISESDASDMYDDMIDDCEEVVSIFGMSYNPSRVLKEVDPIAYRCGFSDFCDSLLDNHQLVEGYY
jgi:hypothetical protein